MAASFLLCVERTGREARVGTCVSCRGDVRRGVQRLRRAGVDRCCRSSDARGDEHGDQRGTDSCAHADNAASDSYTFVHTHSRTDGDTHSRTHGDTDCHPGTAHGNTGPSRAHVHTRSAWRRRRWDAVSNCCEPAILADNPLRDLGRERDDCFEEPGQYRAPQRLGDGLRHQPDVPGAVRRHAVVRGAGARELRLSVYGASLHDGDAGRPIGRCSSTRGRLSEATRAAARARVGHAADSIGKPRRRGAFTRY